MEPPGLSKCTPNSTPTLTAARSKPCGFASLLTFILVHSISAMTQLPQPHFIATSFLEQHNNVMLRRCGMFNSHWLDRIVLPTWRKKPLLLRNSSMFFVHFYTTFAPYCPLYVFFLLILAFSNKPPPCFTAIHFSTHLIHLPEGVLASSSIANQ